MSDALAQRDARLGNFVPAGSCDDYAPRFREHFALDLDSAGVLTVRMHTGGESARWSRGLLNAWPRLLAEVAADPAVEVLVLTGTGEAWLAGVEAESFKTPLRDWHSDELDEQFADSINLLQALVNVAVPTIGVLNGPGFRQEIALLCDLTLAAPDVTIGDGNFAAGSVPGDGMYLVLRELLGVKRAADVVLTGRRLTAQQAHAAGLITEVVTRDQLSERVVDLAHALLRQPRTARRLTHSLIAQRWRKLVAEEFREQYATQLIASAR